MGSSLGDWQQHQQTITMAAWAQICQQTQELQCVQCGPIRICTMTLGAELSHDVDLQRVKSMDFGDSCISLRTKPNNKRKYDDSQPYRQFNNQVTLQHCQDDKQISILLFRNGKLTVAGCKSIDSYVQVMTCLCALLQPVAPGVVVVSSSIHMLNAHVKLDARLALFKLNEQLIEDPRVTCSFDPTSYHAVLVKFPISDERQVSFSIFQSGSMLMTVKGFDELARVHELICSIVASGQADVMIGGDSNIKKG